MIKVSLKAEEFSEWSAVINYWYKKRKFAKKISSLLLASFFTPPCKSDIYDQINPFQTGLNMMVETTPNKSHSRFYFTSE